MLGRGGGGETPPQDFLSQSKIFQVNKKSVHDNAWIVRIQVGPTSECFSKGRSTTAVEDFFTF